MTGINEQISSPTNARVATVGSGTTRIGRNGRKEKPLTLERLKELLTYDPETGDFKRTTVRGGRKVGSTAGTVIHGYICIGVDCRVFQAHRLAWFYTHGVWPKGELDHINRNRSDNRIVNLRETTKQQNQYNASTRQDSTSGFKGVYFEKESKRWKAQGVLDKKRINIGRFSTPEEAARAYDRFALMNYGEFACLNFDELEYL